MRSDVDVDDIELSWCQASLPGQDVLIGGFYRPPNAGSTPIKSLGDSLTKINSNSSHPYIIIGGDFNIPDLDWSNDAGVVPKGEIQTSLLQIIGDNFLTQKVNIPTRKDCSGTENMRDLLLTTHPSLMQNVRPHSGISDHCIIQCSITTKASVQTKPPRNIPLWRKVDEAEFKARSSQMNNDFFTCKPETNSVKENGTGLRIPSTQLLLN